MTTLPSAELPESLYDDIWLFAYQNWNKFFPKNRIKSECVPLTSEFIQYLLQDGIHIPDHLFTVAKPSDTATVEEIVEDPNFFPDVVARIQDAIDILGGEVFPKLDWSSPRDAAWVTHDRTIKCSYVRDILILLKSSKCVYNDLVKLPALRAETSSHTDLVKTHHLVLKKWSKLYPAREFRIFVRNKHIVAVSQRDSVLYEGLQEPATLAHLKEVLSDFHHDYVQSVFPAQHYSYDVYVDTKDKAFLLDMHPWGLGDALLFDWVAELAPLATAVDVAPVELDGSPQATTAQPVTDSPTPTAAPARISTVGPLTFVARPRVHAPPPCVVELWDDYARNQRASGAGVCAMSASLPFRCWSLATSVGLEDTEVVELLLREETALKTEAFELSREGCLILQRIMPTAAEACEGASECEGKGEWIVAWEISREALRRAKGATNGVAVQAVSEEAKETADVCAGVVPFDADAAPGTLCFLPVDTPCTVTLLLEPPLPPCPLADEDDTVNFALRVVTGLTEAEGQRRSTVESVVNRMPVEALDVSDAAAIERFIALQRAMGNVASWSDEDEDDDSDDE